MCIRDSVKRIQKISRRLKHPVAAQAENVGNQRCGQGQHFVSQRFQLCRQHAHPYAPFSRDIPQQKDRFGSRRKDLPALFLCCFSLQGVPFPPLFPFF